MNALKKLELVVELKEKLDLFAKKNYEVLPEYIKDVFTLEDYTELVYNIKLFKEEN